MRKVGIVGGLGPESTVDYYRGIIHAFKPTYEKEGYPEIAIESLDLKTFMSLIGKADWDEVSRCIAFKFEVLRAGGAAFGAIASNTPHRVFEDIQSRTLLPLLSIVDCSLNYSRLYKFSNLCLLGTKITMGSDFYQQIFARENIRLVVPHDNEQEYMQEKIFSEIEFGIIREETRNNFLAIIDRIVQEEKVEGVILGCTELPLLVRPEDIRVQCINTTEIHISNIVDRCRGEQ